MGRPNQPQQGPQEPGKDAAQPPAQDGPQTLESKQGAITADDLKASRPPRWRVPGFRGAYREVVFDNQGVSDRPVSEKTAAEFRAQFPNATVEEIEG